MTTSGPYPSSCLQTSLAPFTTPHLTTKQSEQQEEHNYRNLIALVTVLQHPFTVVTCSYTSYRTARGPSSHSAVPVMRLPPLQPLLYCHEWFDATSATSRSLAALQTCVCPAAGLMSLTSVCPPCACSASIEYKLKAVVDQEGIFKSDIKKTLQ